MSNSKEVYYVVNPRLTYVTAQILLEWCGFESKGTKYVTYNNFEDLMTGFLYENNIKEEKVFVVGFTKDFQKKISKKFDKNFQFFSSEIEGEHNLVEYILKKIAKPIGIKLTTPQYTFLGNVIASLHNNFLNKNAYLINMVFYNISKEKFHDTFKTGWKDLGIFSSVIAKHIEEFKKQPQEIYQLDNKYFFVMGSINYLGDYIYKNHTLFDNICLIDMNTKRVYFKQIVDRGPKVVELCKEFCEDFRGFDGFCSGKITDKFMELTKKMKPYE